MIAKGPFSPQGNCHDSKRVKACEGRRPQADSSTSRPEFIGVSGIYATTDKYTKRLPLGSLKLYRLLRAAGARRINLPLPGAWRAAYA